MPPLRYRILTISLLFFSLATTTRGAGPVISFDSDATAVRLIHKADVGGEVNAQFVATAKGAWAVSQVYGNVSGVLLQASAKPDDALQSLPIGLSYTLQGDHNAVLRIAIGDSDVTSNVPAWIWAVAALFADYDATAAITMSDNPPTLMEKMFRQRWIANSNSAERLLWVRYHLTLDDTLIGFFLLSSDAMLANAQRMRTITNGLRGFDQYSNYAVPIHPAKNRRASRTLDGLIALESQPGDCAMLNDVNVAYVFTIENGDLRIGGIPRYHFARPTNTSDFTELRELTDIFHKNRQMVFEVNPLVYTAVADFAKLIAFFNYIDRTDPDELDEFVRGLKPVLDRIPTIDTLIAVALGTG